MKKNEKRITLILFIISVVLVIVFIAIPPKRTKKIDISPDDYKQEVYDIIKSEIEEDEARSKGLTEDDDSNENETSVDDDELLKVQN